MRTKMIFLFSTLLLLSLSSKLFAEEANYERFNTTMSIDQEGRVSPEAFVPYYWSKEFFSGIGFLHRERTDTDSVEGFSESRLSTNSEEDRYRINILSWQSRPEKLVYSIGGEIQYYSINNLEFGYIHFPAVLGDDWVAFENDIEITLTKPTIKGDLTWHSASKTYNVRAGAGISPTPTLKVRQETRFKPIVTGRGESNSSTSQDLSYELTLDFLYKSNRFIDIGFTAYYEYLPMKYDLAVLDYDSTTATYSFIPSTIEMAETTLFLGIKTLLDVRLFGTVKPAIGFGVEMVKTEDKNTGSDDTTTKNLFTLGFERRF